MDQTLSDQKPGLVTAIAVMTLTSGTINLLWGFIASATALGTIIGVLCLPLTILPTILGIFEILHAAKLLSQPPEPVQASHSMAVFQMLAFLYGNIFSMVVGILNLIFYNDQSVKTYFAAINAPRRPGAANSIPPAASASAEAAPVQSQAARTEN